MNVPKLYQCSVNYTGANQEYLTVTCGPGAESLPAPDMQMGVPQPPAMQMSFPAPTTAPATAPTTAPATAPTTAPATAPTTTQAYRFVYRQGGFVAEVAEDVKAAAEKAACKIKFGL